MTLFKTLRLVAVCAPIYLFIHCKDQVKREYISFGHVDSDWTYKNLDLGIKFKLPRDWYFMNIVANPNTYVRIGSNLDNIEGYTGSFKVPIDDFKNKNTHFIAPLFSISKLENSNDIVRKTFDYNRDKTIEIGMVYKTDSSTYNFLRKTCAKCTDERFKEIYLKNVKLGNTKFDGYITGLTDNEGNKLGHFFGAKEIDGIFVVCQFNFPDLQAYDDYRKYFDGFSIN